MDSFEILTREEAAFLSNASTSPHTSIRFEAWVQEMADVQNCAQRFEGSPNFLVVLIRLEAWVKEMADVQNCA